MFNKNQRIRLTENQRYLPIRSFDPRGFLARAEEPVGGPSAADRLVGNVCLETAVKKTWENYGDVVVDFTG